MRHVFALCLVVFLFDGQIAAREFQKIAYRPPYGYLLMLYENGKILDTSGMDVPSYFAQMDSLGITISIDRATAFTTSNPYGIRIWGQWNMPRYFIRRYWGLEELLHVHHRVIAEAENNEPLLGYSWIVGDGTSEPHLGRGAWFLDPTYDDADTVLISQGHKFEWKYDRARSVWPNKARFTLASSDSVTADTICDVAIQRWENRTVIDTIVDSLGNITYVQRKERFDTTTVYSYTGVDFGDVPLETWKTFTTPDFGIEGNGFVRVAVYWRGDYSFWIDKIEIADIFGDTLASISDVAWDQAFNDFYASINTAGHERFYYHEESYPSQHWGIKKYDDHAYSNGPHHRFTEEITHPPYLAQYLRDIAPNEVMVMSYPIWDTCYSTETNGNTTGCDKSVQVAFDRQAASLQDAADTISGTGADFYMITQAGGVTSNGLTPRQVTTSELRIMISMGVLYGIKGISYFTYSQLFLNDNVPLIETEGIRQPVDMASNFDEYAEAPDLNDPNLISYNGLVDWNPVTTRFEPNERWHAADTVHKYIDSIWPVLDTLEWDGADDWKGITSLSPTIDSIYSTTFPADSTYIHIGRWTSTTGEEFYGFVNRRTLSSESQDAVIEFRNTPGAIAFYDVAKQTTSYSYDSCGTVRHTIHLGPGEMRFYKVQHIQNFAGNWQGTWPQYSTINVVGDVTVPSGETLTIQTSNLTVASFSDSLAAGTQSNRIEFHVNGELRLLGQTSGSRVTLGPSGTTDQSWTGIVAEGSGKVYAQYAAIRNAYRGCYFMPSCTTSVDTVRNTNFVNCYALGFNMRNQHSYAFQDTITHPASTANTTTGIECYSHGDVVQCVFENIKSPIKLSQAACPVIDDCSFVTWHDYSGNSAIDIGTSSSPSITDCEFDNYETGIKIAGNCTNVHITGCSFYSSCFLDLREQPWMEKAIDGAQPTFGGGKGGEYYYFPNPPTSFCTVRQCCFDAIYITHVISGRTDINLGTSSSDQGDNTFICDSFVTADNKTILIPYLNIENQMPDSVVWAQYNHWDCRRLSGAVDTTGAMSAPQYTCRMEQQGSSNDPGGPYKVAPIDTIAEVSVAQNYPNPFNPVTIIPLSLPQSAHVTIQVINVVGQTVATLVDGEMAAGEHTFQWNGVGGNGQAVASGVYFYRVCIGDVTETKKMILLK
jgi:hypothetical protein